LATSLATLLTYRDEAVAARHALVMGQAVIEVRRDGRSMRYSEADLGKLNDYIAQLDREIEMATADSESRPRRGAISFRYR
jgi:hypothetical protein